MMSYVISRIDVLCPKHRGRSYYYSLESDLGYPEGEAGHFPYITTCINECTYCILVIKITFQAN